MGACLVCRGWYVVCLGVGKALLLLSPIPSCLGSLSLSLASRTHSFTHPPTIHPQRQPYSNTVILHAAQKGRGGPSWLWSGNCEGMGTVPLWRVVWMTADWRSRGSPSVVTAGLDSLQSAACKRDSNEFLGRLVAFHTSIGPSRHVPGNLKTARNGRLAD